MIRAYLIGAILTALYLAIFALLNPRLRDLYRSPVHFVFAALSVILWPAFWFNVLLTPPRDVMVAANIAALCLLTFICIPAHASPLPLPDPHGYVAPDGRSFDALVAAHVLPDPTVTPGVINSAVTIAQVCTPDWTKTVRPPTSWTDKLRAADAMPGHKPIEGELDHLLSIEDLGAPADPRNLWWMIYADRYGARVKDVLETKLHRLICTGKITPAQAQAALAPNWLVGYVQFVGPLP